MRATNAITTLAVLLLASAGCMDRKTLNPDASLASEAGPASDSSAGKDTHPAGDTGQPSPGGDSGPPPQTPDAGGTTVADGSSVPTDTSPAADGRPAPADEAVPDLPMAPDAPQVLPDANDLDRPADAAVDASNTSDAPGTCPTGQKSCTTGSTTTCIPTGACCVRSDCPGACQTCNASHACVALVNQDDPDQCAGTCDSTGACKSKKGQVCQTSSTCVGGTTCSPDGYCCDKACTGSCEACDIQGHEGTCTPVPSGGPHNNHGSCGTDPECGGTCTGKADGTCSYPSSNCGVGPSCANGTHYGQAVCEKGTCKTPTPETCPSTGCNATTHTCNLPCQSGTTACGSGCCAFTGGPCAVSPDLNSVEVFAMGDDHNVHRRVFDGTTWGTWQTLSAVNGSLIDIRSDLDCSATTNTIHLVGLSSSHPGGFMHATGFGTTYNQFTADMAGHGLSYGVAVSVIRTDGSGRYERAGVGDTGPAVEDVTPTDGARDYEPLSPTRQLTSGPDLAYAAGGNSSSLVLAAYDAGGRLALDVYYVSTSGSHWDTSTQIEPPTNKAFSFSPAVFAESNFTANVYTWHLVAVAGGKLWHSENPMNGSSTFSAWEEMGNTDVTSAPDCTVAKDSTVHAVALTPSGTVVDVHGKTGNWTTSDLGTY